MLANAKPRPIDAQLPAGVTGALFEVSPEGLLQGWAWCPDQPGLKLKVEILVDGQVVGVTEANLQHQDMQGVDADAAEHGLHFLLPDAIVARSSLSVISARDRWSGQAIGHPIPFCRPAVVDAVARIAALENKARLLQASLSMLIEQRNREGRAADDIFATVGAMFAQLAEEAAGGRAPCTARSLQTAIQDIQTRFQPLELSYAAAPSVSILIGASDSVEAIYKTLRAVQRTLGGVRAEILFLDNGTNSDAALLPLIVTNLRYLRSSTGAGPARVWNQAARLARSSVLVFCDAGIEPVGNWLRHIVTRFGSDASIGILRTVNSTKEDQSINSFLKTTFDSGEAARILHAKAPNATLDTDTFALRLDLWHKYGGFDETLGVPEFALLDFTKRITAHGAKGVVEPLWTVKNLQPEETALIYVP